MLIFNKLLTSSEHRKRRNRNKPFYIYKGLIQWQKADPASSPWPMYMHESNAIRFLIVAQRSSRCPYTLLLIELPTPVDHRRLCRVKNIASIFLTLHKRLCVDIGIFFLPETSPCEMRPWFDDMIMMTILFMVIINKYS